MQTAQVLGYPLILIAALELFLGFLLLKQNSRNSRVNQATAACAFAAAAWSLSAGLMYVRLSLGLDYLPFARLSWIGWFTVPTALQTVFYLKDERSRKARVAGMVLYPFWTAVLALCLFTDLVVTRGFTPLPFINSPGPLEMPMRLTGSIMAFWLIYEIARLRRQVTGFRRTQLSYYLYGTVIFGTGGAVVGGILQLFTGRGLEPSLSAYFSLPWVLMIFYAITRHRLFDIRLIVSRALIILSLSFCVSALQFVLFKVLDPVIGPIASIFLSVPVIGIIFFGTPLSGNVQQWINDLVLKGRYQYQKMLKDSANAMAAILDRDELLRFIVDTVRTSLGSREVILYLRGPDGSYSIRHCRGGDRTTADGCVLPDNVAAFLEATREPIIGDELEAGPSDADTGLRETIRRMGAEVMLPLYSKDHLQGVLTLNERSNGEPYLQGDIDALQTLAGQAAVAIENARLFDEAVQAQASLKESEDIFRTLAETSNAAILIFRPDEVIYANPALSRMSGYAIHELRDMGPFDLIHPDHREMLINRGESRLRGEEVPTHYEFKFMHRDGSARWAITSSARLLLRGRPALLSTMVDITDLKQAEEARAHFYRESVKHYQEKIAEQERFSAILQAASDGFLIVNEENRIIFVNDAYCRMSGYTREEVLTMAIADLEADESPEVVRIHTDNIRLAGHDRFETRHRRKDGSLIDLEISVNRYKDEKTVFSFQRDITDRKRAEKEKAKLTEENLRYLQERMAEQARFAAVVSATNEGFYICDNGSRFMFVNDAYCRLLGYSRDELLTLSVKDLEASESAEMVDDHSRRVIREGHDLFQTRHRRKDGTPIDLEINVNRFEEDDLFYSFVRDITERKKAEEERVRLARQREQDLRDRLAEQERFQSILANAKEGFWITDEQDRFLFVNDAYLRLMGWERGELMQKSIGDVEVLERPEVIEQHTRRIREQGYEIFETQHRRKDGTPVDLEVSVTYYPPERVFFSFFRDIRERKRAEEALRRSEERFRQVSETAQEWIWEVDLDGRYTYSSPIITTLLGYEPEEVVGKRFFFDFFVPEEREQLKRDAFRVFSKRESFREFMNRNLRKDGEEVIFSTSGMPILDDAGNLIGYRGADFDVTARIRAEQERNRFYEESVNFYQALLDEQHRHQEEKEKILKDLHDGIGGITTNVNLLAELAQQSDDLASIKSSLATIAALSRDSLLEIRSFIQSLDTKELTWQAIAAEFRSLGNSIIVPHGIAFSLDARVADAVAGPTSSLSMNLFRVYKESLSNIIKHAKATKVDVRFAVEGRRVFLAVHDNGIGLAEKRGSGRGLINMQNRAKEMGGILEVTTDNGTRLRLDIPLP